MKKKIGKEPFIVLLVFVIIGVAIGGVYIYRKNSARNALAARIAELSPGGAPPETIEELREAIDLYEQMIEQHVRDAAQTGIYWKILATRLQDRGLHNEALEALERTIYYYPEDPTPHYLTGLSAGVVAKSVHDFGVTGENTLRQRYYRLSEESYLRAIELDGRYARPMYGLAVLYVYELDRPEDAIPYLHRYLELRTRDTDAMFILATAYYLTGEFEPALEQYDRILAVTNDAARRDAAERNKQEILDLLYGL
ncbi:tetratricopeptide repeat protein [Breznakiella homolactica]|uniref:Tetratricopeptide repeat protein n=1 Tax=Breznakiella homolactica TaxID=2798577 RepID=A0A7T7XJF6_9SPIR|nr:tetratricopeptide repeat protein [Breznakiella homolactica]QQO07405.1 tetratricopeptide repeat protein [Breznakiella homolactica]